MGYQIQDIEVKVCLRLDSHGGEKEREHEALAVSLERELIEAASAILSKEEYREIIVITIPDGMARGKGKAPSGFYKRRT